MSAATVSANCSSDVRGVSGGPKSSGGEHGGECPLLTARLLPRTPMEVDTLREKIRAQKEIEQLESRFSDNMNASEARSAKDLARLKK